MNVLWFCPVYTMYTHIASNAMLPRQLWLSILAWLVFEFGLSFAVVPVYPDLYGIAKWVVYHIMKHCYHPFWWTILHSRKCWVWNYHSTTPFISNAQFYCGWPSLIWTALIETFTHTYRLICKNKLVVLTTELLPQVAAKVRRQLLWEVYFGNRD